VAYIQSLPEASKGTAQKLVREEGWKRAISYLDPNLESHAMDLLIAEAVEWARNQG